MRLKPFERLARRMWEEIPEEAREGVDALSVDPRAIPHELFSDVFTLGECITEIWPSGYGDGDTRSELVMYHGSFRELAALDESFDWEEELWETILHELLHHREAAAGQYGLDEFDWAEEENRARLVGWPFDPDFYRAVPRAGDGLVRLDSQLFLETWVDERARDADFEWRGGAWTVRVPPDVRVSFVDVRNLAGGRLCVVVRRRKPWWRLGRGGGPPAVLESSALPLPPADGGEG